MPPLRCRRGKSHVQEIRTTFRIRQNPACFDLLRVTQLRTDDMFMCYQQLNGCRNHLDLNDIGSWCHSLAGIKSFDALLKPTY
jgi:hypothetical protein